MDASGNEDAGRKKACHFTLVAGSLSIVSAATQPPDCG
jgi:hypothetical protein